MVHWRFFSNKKKNLSFIQNVVWCHLSIYSVLLNKSQTISIRIFFFLVLLRSNHFNVAKLWRKSWLFYLSITFLIRSFVTIEIFLLIHSELENSNLTNWLILSSTWVNKKCLLLGNDRIASYSVQILPFASKAAPSSSCFTRPIRVNDDELNWIQSIWIESSPSCFQSKSKSIFIIDLFDGTKHFSSIQIISDQRHIGIEFTCSQWFIGSNILRNEKTDRQATFL